MKFVIKAENLRKYFSIGKVKVPALQGVDLEVKPGEFIMIYGPSGCGKTTLLSLLAGMDEPDEGQIFIREKPLSKFSKNQLAHFRRSKIGMVFQQFNLIPALSALRNTILPLSLSGIKRGEKIKRAKQVLEMVGLSERASHKPAELSGGEQQRVAIARALAVNPWILLIDEPTGNLDYETGMEIMKLLSEINQRYLRTILLVTHNPDYFQFANRILYMKDGKIIKSEINTKEQGLSHQKGSKEAKYFIPSKVRGKMGFFDVFRLSWAHFSFNKLRNFFTVLGVVLGIAAIVGLVSLGTGLQMITTKEITASNPLLTISVSPSKTSAMALDDKIVEEFKQIPGVAIVSPEMTLVGQGTLMETTTSVMLTGLEPEYFDFEGVEVTKGQAFLKNEEEVVMSMAALKLFDIQDPEKVIGEEISFKIMDEEMAEITEFKAKIVGVSSGESIANIFIPFNLVKKVADQNYTQLAIKAYDRKQIDSIREKVEERGFVTSSIKDLISEIDRAFLIIQIVLGVIGGIALSVASLGIINTMTISLLERTHEIGILKAIGASNRDIRRLFLYEASLYGIIGGVIGVLTAVSLGKGINVLINYLISMSGEGGQMTIFITPLPFGLGMILFAISIALIAGVYPARRAMRLKPMEALRYE